jgi:hypothetical protein
MFTLPTCGFKKDILLTCILGLVHFVMILKTGPIKESKKEVIISYLVGLVVEPVTL